MKRNRLISLLLLLTLLVALTACAQDPAPEAENAAPPESGAPEAVEASDTPVQPETPDESEIPDTPEQPEQPAALLGDLQSLLNISFWELTGEALIAQLDPAVWTVFTKTSGETELTYVSGTFCGYPAALYCVPDPGTGLIHHMEIRTNFCRPAFEESIRQSLAGTELWNELEIAQPGEEAEAAQWVADLRAALAGAGAALSEPLCEMDGADAPALTETLTGLVAQGREAVGQSETGLQGYLYRELPYAAPNGAQATLCVSYQLADYTEQGGPVQGVDNPYFRCELALYAPDQNLSGNVENPSTVWAEEPGLWDLTAEEFAAQLDASVWTASYPYGEKSVYYDGTAFGQPASLLVTWGEDSLVEALAVIATYQPDADAAALEAERQALDASQWSALRRTQIAGAEAMADFTLQARAEILARGGELNPDGYQALRGEDAAGLIAETFEPLLASGGSAGATLHERYYVMPDGGTAQIFTNLHDGTLSLTLARYSPDYVDGYGARPLDYTLTGDPYLQYGD